MYVFNYPDKICFTHYICTVSANDILGIEEVETPATVVDEAESAVVSTEVATNDAGAEDAGIADPSDVIVDEGGADAVVALDASKGPDTERVSLKDIPDERLYKYAKRLSGEIKIQKMNSASDEVISTLNKKMDKVLDEIGRRRKINESKKSSEGNTESEIDISIDPRGVPDDKLAEFVNALQNNDDVKQREAVEAAEDAKKSEKARREAEAELNRRRDKIRNGKN